MLLSQLTKNYFTPEHNTEMLVPRTQTKTMEITLNHPKTKTAMLHANNNNHRRHTFTSPSARAPPAYPNFKPSIQIQLPLHRPQLKPLTKPPRKTTTTTTSNNSTSDVLRLMDGLGLPVPIQLYISLTKECTATRDVALAIDLHTHLDKSGIRPNLALLNRLLLMYVSCNCTKHARKLFDEMPVKDLYSWASMIGCYVGSGEFEEAINLFIDMDCRNQFFKNKKGLKFSVSWVVVCILKACASTLNLEFGRQVHGWLMKAGCSEDLFLSSSLINFYGKTGCLEGADFVFDQACRRNTIVWTARIVNNCREEHYNEVFKSFKAMCEEGVKKNSFTFSAVLSACGKMNNGEYVGRQIHASVIKLGLESKSYVQSALVYMYGKFGLVNDARKVFEINGSQRNTACWNALLTSYIRHGLCIEGIKICYEMKVGGLRPHELLLNELRLACGTKTGD